MARSDRSEAIDVAVDALANTDGNDGPGAGGSMDE